MATSTGLLVTLNVPSDATRRYFAPLRLMDSQSNAATPPLTGA